MLTVEFNNVSVEGEPKVFFRTQTERTALEFLKLIKEVDSVFCNGQMFKYQDCSFDISTNNAFRDVLSIDMEVIGA